LALALVAAAPVARAQNIVATVDGVEIPASRISLYAQRPIASEQERRLIVNNIVASHLLAEAAKKAGFEKRDEIRERLIIAQQAVLGQAYVADLLKAAAVDDAQVQKRYDEFLKNTADKKEYEVSHILVEKKEKAEELLAELKEDKDAFAKLAKEHSTDTGSGANGGDLGWVSAAALVPEFGKAMESMDKNQTSAAPVQTQFGWHIIRVNDIRDLPKPELTPELRERITQALNAETVSEHIEQLRKEAKVEIR
jgi:peptidyl-prolyl cis-trans isomerase C